MTRASERPLLAVHAHPDDEVLGTGGVIAQHVEQGGSVTLVTCTLGEEGEILVPELAHLAADRDGGLGEHRIKELADSMRALGVQDSRFLGEAGRYRDSGMMGTSANSRPDAFWQADLREAADLLVPVIREVRPFALVTYDDFGGYGHPDHIQAHRVAMYAAQLAAAPSYRPDLGTSWDISKIYWTAFPKSALKQGVQALRDRGDRSAFATMDPDAIPIGVDDAAVSTAVDVSAQLPKKRAAMEAHASQISLEEGFFALSDQVGMPIFSKEFFRLVRGAPTGPLDEDGRETGLFG